MTPRNRLLVRTPRITMPSALTDCRAKFLRTAAAAPAALLILGTCYIGNIKFKQRIPIRRRQPEVIMNCQTALRLHAHCLTYITWEYTDLDLQT